nr:glyceraldehyde-3-phosphate dehydrogenase-like family protein [Tanacetum cinerariifolium]
VIQGPGAGNNTTAAGVLADILDLQDLDKQPLVIQGPGAGNNTTAAGVLADILDLQDLYS